MKGLFRPEASDAALHKRLYGQISLAQPIALQSLVAAAVVIVAALLTFLATADYARKETVRGYLLPEPGVIKAFPGRSGLVSALYVREGDLVDEGQAIADLAVQTAGASGQELAVRLQALLDEQRQNVERELAQQAKLHEKRMAGLRARRRALRETLAGHERQQQLLGRRLDLLRKEAGQYATLHAQRLLSDSDYDARLQRVLLAEQGLEELKGRLAALEAERAQLEADISAGPVELELTLATIENRLSELRRRQEETRNSVRFVVTAPEAGTIASVPVLEGEFIMPGRPLAAIIPKGSRLVAELLLPTRSAGFVAEGDEARLRFDAFPYQRFGFVGSTVERIDKAVVLEGEASLPMPLREPVYRVRTRLDAQGIHAYGETFAFKSGMLLEADIILDRRSLLDWLLSPLYALKGRVS